MHPIFNGKNLEGWSKYLKSQGVNKDLQNVFTVKDEAIHVSGQDFGYIVTNKTYGDFHLSLEFKWGEKKFPPREKDKRDAGVCFSVDLSTNKIWPRCAECQIQEGDVGDLWLVDSVTAFVDGIQMEPKDYSHMAKIRDAERTHGEWNTVEVIFKKGRFKFFVNGTLVNEGEYLTLTSGRILLQSEGAEVFYRKVKIEEF
ncbi:3-keto-disaccharide hydrolase [Pedobacter sp. PWIIR3]